GRLEATVHAQTIRVEGTLTGDLFASEQVQIAPTAQIRGNVTAPRVVLQDGAKFRGAIEMDPQAVQTAFQMPARTAAAPAEPAVRAAATASSTTPRESTRESAAKTEATARSEGKPPASKVAGI